MDEKLGMTDIKHVRYPNDSYSPTEEWIDKLKVKISEMLPIEKFSKEMLDKNYELLTHPKEYDDKCHYDPKNMENHTYDIDMYGHRDDFEREDEFHTITTLYTHEDL